MSHLPTRRDVRTCAWVYAGGHIGSYFTRTPLCLQHTAGTALPDIPSMCVCVSPPLTHSYISTLCIHIWCISYNLDTDIDDGRGIFLNPDHKPTSLLPVNQNTQYSMQRSLCNHVIVHEPWLTNYNSWLRGMKGTLNRGQAQRGVCVSVLFLAVLNGQFESESKERRKKIQQKRERFNKRSPETWSEINLWFPQLEVRIHHIATIMWKLKYWHWYCCLHITL